MGMFRHITPATYAAMRDNGYTVEVVYRWTDAGFSSHGPQRSFYSASDLEASEPTIREHLSTMAGRVIYARDMATGRFVHII